MQQFYNGVPAILPKPDDATAVELFSTLARNVLGSFAFSFRPGFRRPWITEQTWAILQQLLEARRTRLATIRWCRRSLLCLAFSAWHRHKQDHRLRACDYHHQCALFDYRVAFATWNERYFGVAARRACRADYQAWLLEQTERISAWSVRSSARGGDWSHDLCWLTRVTLPRNCLESLSSWRNSSVRSLATGSRSAALTTSAHFLFIAEVLSRRGPCRGRRLRSIGASHRSTQDGEGDRSRLCPQRDPPWRCPEHFRDFYGPRGAGITGSCSHVLERWYDDTCAEAGEGAPGSGQRTGGPPQHHAGQALRQVPQERSNGTCSVRSAADSVVRLSQQNIWPTSALPSTNRRRVTSADIFLYFTSAFYSALPELVLGPLPAGGQCQGHHGFTRPLRTGTLTPSFESATRNGPASLSLGCARAIHWRA